MSTLAPSTDTTSVLAGRNPVVKLAAVTFLSLVVLPVFDPVTPLLLYGVTLAGVLVTAPLTVRQLAVAHLPFLVFGTSLLLVNAVTRGGTVVADLGPLQVTDDGLRVGAALAVRTLLVGVSVIAFVRTTDPIALMTSLRLQARLPDRLAFALLAAYRLLDELPDRWTTIRRAHAVRAPSADRSRLPRSPRALRRAAFTLLVTSIREAERLAVTLELRGLGAGARTTWKPTRVDRGDLALLATVVTTTSAIIVVSAAAGWLRGFSALTG